MRIIRTFGHSNRADLGETVGGVTPRHMHYTICFTPSVSLQQCALQQGLWLGVETLAMKEAIHSHSSPSAVEIYKPFPRPPIDELEGEIQFCHPGYTPPHDVLFTLPRLDTTSAALERLYKGVHYGTALLACQVIANNAEGYLTYDREGSDPVELETDDVLTESQYWFFTEFPRRNPYPVVPSFRDWAFPHGSPLLAWPRPQYMANTDTADGRCNITQTAGLVSTAHLVPVADEEWYKINAMSRHGDHHDVNQDANKIVLRRDLCHAFDDNYFAIIHKLNSYVVHQLSASTTSTREFASTYHNHAVRLPRDVAPEFLFARFARAVLMLAKPFIAQSPVRRYVVRFGIVNREDTKSKNQNAGAVAYKAKSEWLSPTQLYEQYGAATATAARSRSSSERGQNDEKPVHNRKEREGGDSNSRNDTVGDSHKKKIVVLEEGRGRPRKRLRRDLQRRRDWTL
ncbi:hypothetical protein F5Y10DRAFT_285591 [Nemania abortiva]|nr:hypothetical protein F5Y10DRAFT_285591 [Nemania abortiva]